MALLRCSVGFRAGAVVVASGISRIVRRGFESEAEVCHFGGWIAGIVSTVWLVEEDVGCFDVSMHYFLPVLLRVGVVDAALSHDETLLDKSVEK